MIDAKHRAEFARAIRNHQYERNDTGVYFPRANVFIGGAVKFRDYRTGVDEATTIQANTLLDEGLIHMLGVTLCPSLVSPISQWYIAPFSGNYTPNKQHTAAQLPTVATEFTQYAAPTRMSLTVNSAPVTPSAGNTGDEAVLVFTGSGTYDIYGVFLTSSPTKNSNSGKALAAVRLENPKTGFKQGDKIGVEYVLSAADAG